MSTKLRTCMAGMLCLAMLSATACTANDRNAADDNTPLTTRRNADNQPRMLNQQQIGRTSIFSVEQDATIPIVSKNNQDYIPLLPFLKVLQFRNTFDPNTKTYSIGDNDVIYKLTIDSTQAVKEDGNITVASAPIMIDGQPHIPVSIIHDIFQEDMDYTVKDHTLYIRTSPSANQILDIETPDGGETDPNLEFGDDPNDPANAKQTMVPVTDKDGNTVLDEMVWTPTGGLAVPTLKNIDTNALINTAKRYLGVRYVFGAAPYPRSGVFDCSTFTGYVFGKYGIKLPRTARAQARRGVWVSRKALRKGDLLFFYWPGRFKSNKIVGHVGIYMGNNRMIHTIPKGGVQIVSINKPYWKKVYLTAKRFVY